MKYFLAFVVLVLAAGILLDSCRNEGGSKPAGAPPAARYAQDGALLDGTKVTWRPNVLVVCASGLRHVDAFPATWTEPPPPEFTAFAARATVFENAAATAGWEGPSFVSLLTGMWPKSHGILSRRGEEMGTLIPAHVMPAEILRSQGWRTGAFTEGGALSRGRGLEQGFDTFVDDWKVERGEAVEAWIGAAPKDQPFFLVVHMALHDAKTPRETAARLLERFTTKASARTPLVTVFTADCGRPAGGAAFNGPGASGPGPRGDSLAEEWVHVPLAISAPGRFPPGRRAGSCSIADVAPTILDLAGLPRAPEMNGTSLLKMAADAKDPGVPVRGHASLGGYDLFMVRTADAKFVARRDVAAQRWTEETFDLRKDPKETAPLPGDRVPSLGAAFAAAVEELRARLAAKDRLSKDIGDKGYSAGGGY